MLSLGYVCYITITGYKSQHSAVVLLNFYATASEHI